MNVNFSIRREISRFFFYFFSPLLCLSSLLFPLFLPFSNNLSCVYFLLCLQVRLLRYINYLIWFRLHGWCRTFSHCSKTGYWTLVLEPSSIPSNDCYSAILRSCQIPVTMSFPASNCFQHSLPVFELWFHTNLFLYYSPFVPWLRTFQKPWFFSLFLSFPPKFSLKILRTKLGVELIFLKGVEGIGTHYVQHIMPPRFGSQQSYLPGSVPKSASNIREKLSKCFDQRDKHWMGKTKGKTGKMNQKVKR